VRRIEKLKGSIALTIAGNDGVSTGSLVASGNWFRRSQNYATSTVETRANGYAMGVA